MLYLSVIIFFFPVLTFTETSSPSLKNGAYVLIGVGALTMLMGFLGCLGAVNEIRCLLALVREFVSLRYFFLDHPLKSFRCIVGL